MLTQTPARAWPHSRDMSWAIGAGLALALATLALFPLFYPGFFHNHAGLLPAYQALGRPGSDLVPDAAAGWAPGTGYTQLPMRGLALLQQIGLDPTGALKVLHGAAILLGAAGAFVVASGLARRQEADPPAWTAGFLAATIYTFLPYRLASTYVRGDVFEAVALAFAPWAFWGLADTSKVRVRGYPAVVSVLALAATSASQLGIGLGTALTLCAVGWAAGRLRHALVVAGLAAVLSAVAWVPLLFAPTRPALPLAFAQPANLFLAQWGYGETPAQGLPLAFGVVAIGLALLALWTQTAADRRLRFTLAGTVALAALFSLDLARPAWGPLASLFGQPWQVLALGAVPLTLLAARWPLPRPATLMAGVLALAAGLASYSYLQPIFLPALDRQTPVLRTLGDRIVLLAYRIEPVTNGRLVVQLDWQALADGYEDYTVFVHVLDAHGHLVAQRDQPPFNGQRPTSGWARGEVIRDRYPIDLPPGLLPGRYRVVTGMYRPGDGTRLTSRTPAGTAPDTIALTEVELP